MLWDTRTGEQRAMLEGHTGYISAVAVSPDGLTVASGSGDRTFKLWDARTGKEQVTLGIDCVITELRFSADLSKLHTNRGILKIPLGATHLLSRHPGPPLADPALFVEDQWTVYRTERLLWLPPDYRPSLVAVYCDLVILAQSSERIHFLYLTWKYCRTFPCPPPLEMSFLLDTLWNQNDLFELHKFG
jgi:hypothetical protein